MERTFFWRHRLFLYSFAVDFLVCSDVLMSLFDLI